MTPVSVAVTRVTVVVVVGSHHGEPVVQGVGAGGRGGLVSVFGRAPPVAKADENEVVLKLRKGQCLAVSSYAPFPKVGS